MRKVFYVVLIIGLFVGTASAYLNQPLGWQGWSWGTSLGSISGWLNYDSTITKEEFNVTIDFFNRQGESRNHLGTKWNTVTYCFIEKQLEGICLVADGELYSIAALASLFMQYGEANINIELKSGFICHFWEGEYGNVLTTFFPEDEENEASTFVFIGTKRFMDATAAGFIGFFPTISETVSFMLLTEILENEQQ